MRRRILAILTVFFMIASTLLANVSAANNPFSDISASDYYHDAVMWALENGVTSGTTSTTFSPFDTCTRGQVMTFLWRANGEPEPENFNNPFVDVAADKYYYKAILWAVEKGITAGTTATTFSPNSPCTYSQVLTFLWRGNDSPNPKGESELAANYGNSYYVNAVAWADTNGMLARADFDPSAKCPRADIVYYIYLSNNGRAQMNVVSSTEPTALSEYSQFQYSSLISDNSRYLGQRIKVIGTIAGVLISDNTPHLNIYEKGDYQLNYYAKYDPTTLTDIVEYKYEDDVEVYGVIYGTEPYGTDTLPAISIEQIRPLSVSGGIKVNHEYGPFTIYQYYTSESLSDKLYAQYDITSFQVKRIGFSSISSQKNQYYVDCQLNGKCKRDYCRIVIQFLDDSGKTIGETTVGANVTADETFSVSVSVYIDMELIEKSDSIRFVSSTGDLANTPRKETTTSGSSNSSTSGTTKSGTGTSGTTKSGTGTTSGNKSSTGNSSSTQNTPRTLPSRDSISEREQVPCSSCDGLGFCPKCSGAGTIDCPSCVMGKCDKCAGRGTITKRAYDKDLKMTTTVEDDCTRCGGTGDCTKCGGEAELICPTCHGSMECRVCHGSGWV